MVCYKKDFLVRLEIKIILLNIILKIFDLRENLWKIFSLDLLVYKILQNYCIIFNSLCIFYLLSF